MKARNEAARPRKVLSEARDWHIYGRLLGYARTMIGFFALAVVGYLCEAGAMGALAEILDRIIDTIQAKAMSERWWLAVVIVGVVLLRGIAATVGDLALAQVSFSIVHRLRCELFDRVLQLPTAYFDRTAQGHLVSRITFNVAQLRDTTTEALKTVLEEGALVVGLMGYLLYKNWKLTLVFIVIAPLIGWVMDYAGRRFRRISRRIQDSMGDVTHVASETVSGYRAVRVFGGSAYERARFFAISEYNRLQNVKMAITKAASAQTVQVFTAIAVAILVILVFEPSIMNGMDTGAIIAYITATGVMLKPIKKLSEINAVLQRGLAAAEDVFAQLDEPLEIDQGTREVERVQGRVEFRDVSFVYERGGSRSLDSVSFAAEPGMTVALVGRSGSGKSTLTSLLARFYSPESGQILIDGVPIEGYSLASLRRQIALVSQQVTLFNDSVRRNIAYGELTSASDADVIEAATKAHAMQFIEQMPEGLETLVGDNGVLLSGGQRQRLAIARALLKDAPILILDEATSALDSESERAIQAGFDAVMGGRTTFVVAHRLSTIERADLILVMEDGRIIEQGTHAELLLRNGAYSALHRMQFHVLTDTASTVAAEASDVGSNQAATVVDAAVARPGRSASGHIAAPAGGPAARARGLAAVLQRKWYDEDDSGGWLAPVGRLYEWLSTQRRDGFVSSPNRVWGAPVPVIVVGNVTVGGTGKTPFVIWLARRLTSQGLRVGIVSRGYGARSRQFPLHVDGDSDPRLVGDEPPMIAARTGCAVIVDPDRVTAVQALLTASDCDIVLSDDGLQHYRLGRSVEIALVDGARGLGNGQCLPAGPLREPPERLQWVDLLLCTGQRAGLREDEIVMHLRSSRLLHVVTGEQLPLTALQGRVVHGFAGIGNPERFFESLAELGAVVIKHPLPDHYRYGGAELAVQRASEPAGADAVDSTGDSWIVMTEKDAVKCRRLTTATPEQPWFYLEVEASFSAEDAARIANIVLAAAPPHAEQLA